MLKKWQCTVCGKTILGFEEDIIKGALACTEEMNPPRSLVPPHQCQFVPSQTHQLLPTLQGEAGFFTEGTSLDSIASIHDYCSMETDKAEDERELKAYLEARRNA